MSERSNLAEIEARCEAATAGPWAWDQGCLLNEELDRMIVVHDSRYAWEVDDDDQKFIAHARTDLPALVAWVREAREALLLLRGTGPIGDAKRGECRSCEVRWSAGLTEMADNRSHEAHQPNCPWKVCAALLSRLEVERP